MTALNADGLGSVRAVTDETGLPAERSTYRPFGEEAEQLLSLGTPKETKGFIGERFDDTSGLQYLNARYYDPKLAIFIQPDWWEVTRRGVGTNRYVYAGNDPINARDPGGNGFWSDVGKSIKDSFGALGDALSGKAQHIDNAGQKGTGGSYGVVRVGGATYGCFGCSGTGAKAAASVGGALQHAFSKAVSGYLGSGAYAMPGTNTTATYTMAYNYFYRGYNFASVYGLTNVGFDALKSAATKFFGSRVGSAAMVTLYETNAHLKILETTRSGPYGNYGAWAETGKNVTYINPSYASKFLLDSAGWFSGMSRAPLDAVLAHEIGHATYGIVGEQRTVDTYENRYRMEMGYALRGTYSSHSILP